jgi:peptide/nickel transport system permease protein
LNRLAVRAGAVGAGAVVAVLVAPPLLVGLLLMFAGAVVLLPAPSRRHVLRRLPRVVVLTVVATAVIWLLIRVIPDAGRVSRLPLTQAFDEWLDWVSEAATGDLGFSDGYRESVNDGVARTIPITLQLAAYSMILALLVALPAALVAVRWQGRFVDRFITSMSFVLLSIPPIIIAPLIVTTLALGGIDLFGVQVGAEWFPSGRYTPVGEGAAPHLRSMALPTVALAAGLVAPFVAVLRTELIEVGSRDFVLSANARGLPPRLVILRHAFPAAAPRLVAVVAAQIGILLGSIVIIEYLFLLPGFTDYVLVAITRRDLPPLAGGTAIIAASLALINLLADAVIMAMDPRAADDAALNPRRQLWRSLREGLGPAR